MKTVEVRGVKIGEGIPKICVSVMGIARPDIQLKTREVVEHHADIVEWRGDWYCDILKKEKVLSVLPEIREIVGEKPLLFTFRSADEGGEQKIHIKDYVNVCKTVIESGYVDLIDVELFTGDSQVEEIIELAHANNVKVILSNHDFQGTPAKEDIVRRLRMMQDFGADIMKIAVMPQNRKDVLTLLAAEEEMSTYYAKCPMCVISMGKMGAISRICGEIFGSDLTFGAVGKLSAPGQIKIEELRAIMSELHNVSE